MVKSFGLEYTGHRVKELSKLGQPVGDLTWKVMLGEKTG